MKIIIKGESSKDLTEHSVRNADGEIWMWAGSDSNGNRMWGVNQGRDRRAYSLGHFSSAKEAATEVRRMRRQR